MTVNPKSGLVPAVPTHSQPSRAPTPLEGKVQVLPDATTCPATPLASAPPSAPAARASFLLLHQAGLGPAPGPWHRPRLPPGVLFSLRS